MAGAKLGPSAHCPLWSCCPRAAPGPHLCPRGSAGRLWLPWVLAPHRSRPWGGGGCWAPAAPASLSPLLQSPEPPGEAAEGRCCCIAAGSSSAPSWGWGRLRAYPEERTLLLGPKGFLGTGCIWRAGTAALSPRNTRDCGEQDLPRRRPVPSCHGWSWVRAGVQRGQAAAAQPLGPIFAGAGAPWHRNSLPPAARGGRARASGSWTEATCMP